MDRDAEPEPPDKGKVKGQRGSKSWNFKIDVIQVNYITTRNSEVMKYCSMLGHVLHTCTAHCHQPTEEY